MISLETASIRFPKFSPKLFIVTDVICLDEKVRKMITLTCEFLEYEISFPTKVSMSEG